MSKSKLDERISSLLEPLAALEPLDVSPRAARGCLVAEEIRAEADLPPENRSSIAGYAVRSADLSVGKRLDVLKPSGESGKGRGPGSEPGRLADGKAVRVAAGSRLPSNADVVLPLSGVKEKSGRIEVLQVPGTGSGICLSGSIAKTGTVLLTKHRPIDDRSIGLLAATGRERALVVPRPRVVVLSVGDDLVEAPPSDEAGSRASRRRRRRGRGRGKKAEGRKPDSEKTDSKKADQKSADGNKVDAGARKRSGPHPDVTGTLLTAAADAIGATAYGARPVGQDLDVIARSLDDQLIRSDVLVVTGAISAEDDPLREVLERVGNMTFDETSTNLGVFGIGTVGEQQTPVIAVPRHPVTAYLLFRLLVDPVVAVMLGRERPEPETVILGADVARSEDQSRFVLVSLEERGRCQPVTDSAPSLLDLQEADAMIRVDPGHGEQSLRSGSKVPMVRFPLASAQP